MAKRTTFTCDVCGESAAVAPALASWSTISMNPLEGTLTLRPWPTHDALVLCDEDTRHVCGASCLTKSTADLMSKLTADQTLQRRMVPRELCQ